MLRSKFKLSWTQALAEIVLIFIGITLAVTFNNWNENRKNNSLRKAYYERLLTELKQDQLDLSDITQYHLQRKKGIESFFDYMDAFTRPDLDSVQSFIRNFSYHMSSYIPNESTYEELIATGNIQLIDTEIREKLIRLSRMHAYIAETQSGFEVQYEDRRKQMAEVIDEASFYKLRKNPAMAQTRWQRDLNSGGFRRYNNLLAIRLQIANTMTNLFGAVDNRCEELIGLIEAQIQED